MVKLSQHTDLKTFIEPVIKDIQNAILNHEPDPLVVSGILYKVAKYLPEKVAKEIDQIGHDIESYNYNSLSPVEKFENPLRRRLESTIFIQILLNPTTKMMEAVKLVSQQILDTIVKLKSYDEEFYLDMILAEDGYLHQLSSKKNIIACGAFPSVPTIKEATDLLQSNNVKDLPAIMHAHFKFAANIYRKIPLLNVPDREPVGRYKQIVEEFYGNWEEYYLQLQLDSAEGREARGLISDTSMSDSELYTQEGGTRGRLESIKKIFTTQLGLMLETQSKLAFDLPHYGVAWVPDAKGQQPNFNSIYVKAALEFEDLYVAGPSGMTALLLGQSEVLVNFTTIAFKQHYLAAIAAYVVGAGFHCSKEVFDPAEWALSLIPGYFVALPNETTTRPANTAVFFNGQSEIDPEFMDRMNAAWRDYLLFFEHTFSPRKINISPQESKTQFFEETGFQKRKKVEQDEAKLSQFKKQLKIILSDPALKDLDNKFLVEITKVTSLIELVPILKNCIDQLESTLPKSSALQKLKEMDDQVHAGLKKKRI